MSTLAAQQLYEFYQESLERAIQAVHERSFYAHYPEPPSPKVYGESANDDGQKAFEAQLGKRFPLHQEHKESLVSGEISPYTLKPLNIAYPVSIDTKSYVLRSQKAFASWRQTSVQDRAGLLMASLDKVKARFFELAYATMHSTGQAFVMSFQASGPHACDRAIEAIALGLHEMTRFPQNEIEWVKPMGKTDLRMTKRYRQVPLGVGLCIGCSTFPVWNTVPGIYANLITGNTVIVKPHPLAIYPIAIFVQALQETFADQDMDPHIVQLACDTPNAPITNALAENEAVKLIDFTGSNAYGAYLESLPGKALFTEKAGVNSVILDSTDDLKAVANNLAFSVAMYSGQMCSCPQNIFVPKSGIRVAGEQVPYEEVVATITEAIHGIVHHPKMGAGVTGAVQSQATWQRAQDARSIGKVLLDTEAVPSPSFPEARTASPLVLEVHADHRDQYAEERFGPIVLIIPVKDTSHALEIAKELAATRGAISCSAYSTDPEVQAMIEAGMAESFTPVSFNFTGMFWVNQNAGFSDFHVTGGNPAGNATLTDPLYLLRRFVVVGSRTFHA